VITEIKLSRSDFANDVVSLTDINLLCGINGGGKSTFMRIFPLLSEGDNSPFQLNSDPNNPIILRLNDNDVTSTIKIYKQKNLVIDPANVTVPSCKMLDEYLPISFEITPNDKSLPPSPFSGIEFFNLFDKINPALKEMFGRKIITEYSGGDVKIPFFY